MDSQSTIEQLMAKIKQCQACALHLPYQPKPVVRASATAKLLIIGQAPGTKVHQSGIPWNDRSGDRLREWLKLGKEDFYDVSKIAIMPMGFCYPGVDQHGGDKPPRSECAPLWHLALRKLMPHIQLILLVGSYAQRYYLGTRRKASLTATVQSFKEYLPGFFPLPHPSWRNTVWLKANPWFETSVLPELRKAVSACLKLSSNRSKV